MQENWISINDEKPIYNKAVIIFDGKDIHYEWHRLADEDGEFYGSLNTDRMIEHVTHWMPLPEKPKEKK